MRNIDKICHKIYTESFGNEQTIDGVNKCFQNICLLHQIKRFSIVQIINDEKNKKNKSNFFSYHTSYPSAWVKIFRR